MTMPAASRPARAPLRDAGDGARRGDGPRDDGDRHRVADGGRSDDGGVGDDRADRTCVHLELAGRPRLGRAAPMGNRAAAPLAAAAVTASASRWSLRGWPSSASAPTSRARSRRRRALLRRELQLVPRDGRQGSQASPVARGGVRSPPTSSSRPGRCRCPTRPPSRPRGPPASIAADPTTWSPTSPRSAGLAPRPRRPTLRRRTVGGCSRRAARAATPSLGAGGVITGLGTGAPAGDAAPDRRGDPPGAS